LYFLTELASLFLPITLQLLRFFYESGLDFTSQALACQGFLETKLPMP
jgi:hypothetical protein